jgi:hypothetical protein
MKKAVLPRLLSVAGRLDSLGAAECAVASCGGAFQRFSRFARLIADRSSLVARRIFLAMARRVSRSNRVMIWRMKLSGVGSNIESILF